MNKELKPCPFCGGEATLKAVNKSYGLTTLTQWKVLRSAKIKR